MKIDSILNLILDKLDAILFYGRYTIKDFILK